MRATETMPLILGRAALDAAMAECDAREPPLPGEPPVAEMVLTPHCHEDAPLYCRADRATNTLRLSCGYCERHAGDLALGAAAVRELDAVGGHGDPVILCYMRADGVVRVEYPDGRVIAVLPLADGGVN